MVETKFNEGDEVYYLSELTLSALHLYVKYIDDDGLYSLYNVSDDSRELSCYDEDNVLYSSKADANKQLAKLLKARLDDLPSIEVKDLEVGDTVYYVNDGYIGNPCVGSSFIHSIDGDHISYHHSYTDGVPFGMMRLEKVHSSKLFATELEAYKHLAELLKDYIKDLKQAYKEHLSELDDYNKDLQHEVYELIEKVNEFERE